MKKIIDLHQVDAFTDKLFGGNPSGVVTNADGLTDDEMRAIAREMNLSETAFVLTPTVKSATVKLRYFTPEGAEIDFCGHATIGALYQLARLSMHGLGGDKPNTIQVETNAGVLAMSVRSGSDGQPDVIFTAPQVIMEPYYLQGSAFADAFGIPVKALANDSEVYIDLKLNYVYIPITSLKQLGELEFDFARIRSHFGDESIIVFCLFTNEGFRKSSDLHARGLAPFVGIDEDPFTGSMQSGLVHAAKQNNLIDTSQRKLIIEQGNFIGRPGFSTIDHDVATDELTVTASAVQVFSTKLEIQ